MKIFLVYDLANLTQHELFEAWATESRAEARAIELNAQNPGSDWTWNDVLVQQ